MNGRITLVIAHRLSTIRDADEILVDRDGRIVERGPARAARRGGGLYSSLYRRQMQIAEHDLPAASGWASMTGRRGGGRTFSSACSTTSAARASPRRAGTRSSPAAATDVVFLTRGVAAACGGGVRGTSELLIVLAERDGEPVALAPLFAVEGSVSLVGSGDSDYLDFIGRPDEAVLAAMLEAARDAAEDFSRDRALPPPARVAHDRDAARPRRRGWGSSCTARRRPAARTQSSPTSSSSSG